MWKKRTARLLANYWQPRISKIVSDYARDISEIDWNIAKYDDDYLIAEMSQAIESRDCRTRELFEFVRENEKSILLVEIKKIWAPRKRIARKFKSLFGFVYGVMWLVIWFIMCGAIPEFLESSNRLLHLLGLLLFPLLPVPFVGFFMTRKWVNSLLNDQDDYRTLVPLWINHMQSDNPHVAAHAHSLMRKALYKASALDTEFRRQIPLYKKDPEVWQNWWDKQGSISDLW